jgi:sigma-B regulation protein RsbU (phosphoserine phosphatase)
MPVLFIYPKNGRPTTFTIGSKKICLGNASNNDIVLLDQFSSRGHAVIRPGESGYVIQDQGSKNGTFLNGRRLSGDAVLKRGDEILIGSTRIVFDREFQPAVEMTEETTFNQTSSKAIKVNDILQKPRTAAVLGTPGGDPGLEASQRDQKVAAVLGEVSQALIFHMDLDKLLDYIMDLVTRHIPMDRGVLMLKEGRPEELVPKVVRIQSALLKTQKIVVSRSILRASLEKNSSILISDVQSDRNLSEQESILQAQIHSAMCVPLWNNREIMGVIYSDRTALLGEFSEEDLRLLTLLANLAALKIENARLFEESLEKARMEKELIMAQQIQRNFLPKVDPDFEPYDISGSARSCTHVGGDYFDFIPIDQSRLGLVIADVSGHGVSAALLMASLRSSLHALIPGNKDLGLLAAQLNDTVHRDSDNHSFISFFYGVLDRDKREVTFVNAGHNPPLLVAPAGGIQLLDSTGFCLGMFPGVRYGTMTIKMQPGEILCLYTDGIIEGRNRQQEEFSVEGLVEQIRASVELPARDMLDKIYEGVSRYTDFAAALDDMTLVVVKTKASGRA